MESIESWVSNSFPDAAQSVTDLLPTPSDPPARYGGFTLQRGDWDASRGAQPENGERMIGLAAGDQAVTRCGLYVDPAEEDPPTLGLPAYVERLQIDLWVLGFGLIRQGDGFDSVFGRITEQAVREFQIYAGMEQVAQHDGGTEGKYVDHLSSVSNDHVYDGPISGRMNEKTRACIGHWLNNNYRCPVVITAFIEDENGEYTTVYDGSGVAEGADADCLWRDDDLQDSTPRVYAYDFTEYYNLSGTGHEGDDRIVVGQAESYQEYWGQITKERWNHVWDVTKVSMDTFGVGPDEQSTFEVIDAVAEIECQGYLDGMNAYDPACLSAGPYHWTLALFGTENQIGEGELEAFLSYLRSENPEAYQQVFRRFGVDVDTDWGEDGEDLFTHTHKYTASIDREVGRSSGGEPEMAPVPMGSEEDLSKEEAIQEWRYFRNWHWYYRFLMAARTSEAFRQACWDFARLRLEDILTTEWEDAPESWEDGTTIGDVFTSQKARAMILRWHVYSPAQIISYGTQGDQLENALDNAQALGIDDPQVLQLNLQQCERDTPDSELNWAEAPNWNQDPGAWDDRHECQLIRGIYQTADEVGGGDDQTTINETVENIYRDQDLPETRST